MASSCDDALQYITQPVGAETRPPGTPTQVYLHVEKRLIKKMKRGGGAVMKEEDKKRKKRGADEGDKEKK